MQSFELRVHQSSLNKGSRRRAVHELHQVLHCRHEICRRGRNELRLTWVDVAAAHPVLSVARTRLVEVGQKFCLQRLNVGPRDVLRRAQAINSACECGDVVRNFSRRRGVPGVGNDSPSALEPLEFFEDNVPSVRAQALYVGARYCFAPQEVTRYCFELSS